MKPSEFDRIVRSLDEQLVQAERSRTALRNARRLVELAMILRVKLASFLALGAWPCEDLPGMILGLKEEETRFLEVAHPARPRPTGRLTPEVTSAPPDPHLRAG